MYYHLQDLGDISIPHNILVITIFKVYTIKTKGCITHEFVRKMWIWVILKSKYKHEYSTTFSVWISGEIEKRNMKYIKEVSTELHNKKLKLSTAESCTGGWLAKVITDIAGSSEIFDRGFVTYSNKAKQEMLGVSIQTLDKYGAVSEEVVAEMAVGALKNSAANISVSISGIAGPTGGTPEKPVGTVCFAWMLTNSPPLTETVLFSGDRMEIRQQAVKYALQGILKMIQFG